MDIVQLGMVADSESRGLPLVFSLRVKKLFSVSSRRTSPCMVPTRLAVPRGGVLIDLQFIKWARERVRKGRMPLSQNLLILGFGILLRR